jgi:DNA/RNA-binding domain of Phe-tRNA-synthetase-like protein
MQQNEEATGAEPAQTAIDVSITVDPHPLLRMATFTTLFPAPVGRQSSPAWLVALLGPNAEPLFAPDEALRSAIREMLRSTGFKPTGRAKPASEYLLRAARDGLLGSINVPVDACNAVSMHSGFPISVVDLDRAREPFRVGVAEAGQSYVFNRAGHEIDLAGLLCLFDAEGPCANAVKDAQRTKTSDETTRTFSILWGCVGHEPRLAEASRVYQDILSRAGAQTAG